MSPLSKTTPTAESAEAHMAERTCLGCRKVLAKDELVRYVVGPDGEILLDYRGRLPGRGTYTCLSVDCLRQAVAKKQFDRVFRGTNRPPDAARLVGDLAEALAAKVDALIGMGRKSGVIVTGSSEVQAALRREPPPALVLLAGDLSAGIGDKLRTLASARQVPLFEGMDKERLGRLVGKGLRSALAVKRGHLAEHLLRELARYKTVSGER